MSRSLNRRRFLQLTGGTAALAALGIGEEVLAQAAQAGQLTMAFPADVPTWDPNARSLAPVQSLYKTVFDQPLTQGTDLAPQPALVTGWKYLDEKGLALELTFRDDVFFHDGSKMSAEDFRYTFFERPRAAVPEGGRKLDTAFLWRRVKDIEVVSPTKAVMHFSEVMPSAVAWLYFLCSFVVPKAYLERVGLDEFQRKPVGTGPYKVVEYQQGSRIALEAFDRYWGGKPAIQRVTIDIVRDPTARVASVEARRAHVAIDVPIREAVRLGTVAGLTSRLDPTADIMLLQISKNGGFAQEQVRLAAHHAINKEAISRAFFQGHAKPISVPAARGTAGYPEDFNFPFSEEKAAALLKEVGYGPDKPVKIKFFTTNGVFPNDFDMARAIGAMWKKVGIDADIEVIELSTYQERLRAGTLPEATMYQWGNAAGDPEMYGGYLLDPKAIFSAYKAEDLKDRIGALLTEPNEQKRYQGYRDVHRYAVEKGYTIPLLQSTRTVVHQNNVNYVKYDNGWILPQAWSFKSA
jgi:peptide/nickel transport system substrate-binding protein